MCYSMLMVSAVLVGLLWLNTVLWLLMDLSVSGPVAAGGIILASGISLSWIGKIVERMVAIR